MKKTILLFLFCVCSSFAALQNTFQNYAKPFPIRDAKIYDGKLVLATANGIHILDSLGKSTLFTAANGLGSSNFSSIAVANNTLYAISSNGSICRFNKNSFSFTKISTAFEESEDNAVNSVTATGGNFIVIAFKKKLAIFNTDTETFLTSLSKIGPHSIESSPLTSLLISGDSLFVALGKSLYIRLMDWENLSKDRFLIDPYSWKQIPNSEETYSMSLYNGTLKTRPVSGTFFYQNGKEISASEDSSQIIIGGSPVQNENLYRNGKSLVQWILPQGNNFFFVGTNFIGFGNNKQIKNFSSSSTYLLGGANELAAIPQGGIIAVGINGELSYFKKNQFSKPIKTNEHGWRNNGSIQVKALSELPSGEALFSLWGRGLFVFSDYKLSKVKFRVSPTDGSCIENFLENYMVAPSATIAPDNSGFIISYWSKQKYGLAYVDITDGFEEVYCAPAIGNTKYSGAMTARLNQNGDYEIFVASSDNQASHSSGSLDHFVMNVPRKTGSFSVIEKRNIKTPGHNFPIDLAWGHDSTLWAATYSDIFYWSADDSVKVPINIKHFSGFAYSALAVDPKGNLWLSSNGDGLFHLTRKKSNDTLTAVHYVSNNGLLNNTIYDIALDSANGSLWLAHDAGLTQLTRNDLRSAIQFMTDSSKHNVKVYPNPFRAKIHTKVSFDYIAEGARVSLYNAGGKLVKSFANEDLVGGRVDWDGKDDSGNLVAPGTYTYVIIRNGKSEKQGKLLIIH